MGNTHPMNPAFDSAAALAAANVTNYDGRFALVDGLNGGWYRVDGSSSKTADGVVVVNAATGGQVERILEIAPQLTTVQRDAINAPETGSLIYNTTTGHHEYYDGTNWISPGSLAINLYTAAGITQGNTDMGTFAGNVISDNTTIAAALGELENALEDNSTAIGITAGAQNLGTFTGTIISDNGTVKAGMQEVETDLEALQTASGIAAAATNFGTFTGTIISDNITLKPILQELEVDTEANTTALGITGGATNLGTFTGTTISDNGTVKAGMQELETAIEAISQISWSSQNAAFTAAVQNGYFVDVSGGAVTVTLPNIATSGDTIFIIDSTGNSATNNITLNADASDTIEGGASATINTNFQVVRLFADAGNNAWVVLEEGITSTDNLGNHTATQNLDMGTFAITNVGNVDGRDVSTDGTNQDALQTLTGVAAAATNLGTFTGDIITDNSTIKTALQELETDLDAWQTASGLADAAVNFGTFTGTVISDNNTLKPILQELETDVEANTGALGNVAGTANLGTFTGSIISDNGSAKAGMQELETDLEALQTAAGIAAAATDFGTFTGTIITDNVTAKVALQELETDMDAIQTASGIAAAAVNYGTFTGNIISDNVTNKVALQELETALEARTLAWSRQTATFTAAAGNGYIVDTTGGAVTVTLPDITATGERIKIADTGNAATNNITINADGSDNIEGGASKTISFNNGFVELVADGTGNEWIVAEEVDGGADNLGNHTATTDLAMAGFTIQNVDSIQDVDGDTRVEINATSADSDTINLVTAGTNRMTVSSTGLVEVGGTGTAGGALTVTSTAGAFIPPRMTTAQRDALTAVQGAVIFNTTTTQWEGYDGIAWAGI